MRIALFAAGPKGANFLRNFRGDEFVDLVVSYAGQGLQYDAHAEIQSICQMKEYKLVGRENVRPEDYAFADLVLVIGWQWMLKDFDQRFLIFHDSLLPKLRGFNPTVTALIVGETEIGVTAFAPIGGDAPVADFGPIWGQERIAIEYPITIGNAYERLGLAYCRLADRVLHAASLGSLTFSQQDQKNATYSLWRNEDDYQIDWALSAVQIRRFVDAVGWPYMGAKSALQGREIRIDHVEICRDLAIVNRSPGKIWSLAGGVPEVVCGTGMLRIVQAREVNGDSVIFKSLRTRLK
jgi:methionyl-tRNA formyltransferase